MKEIFDLGGIIKNVSKVKLPGGVVGKVCKVLIIVAVCMAVIAWSVKIVWVSLLSIVFMFILTFFMLWRLINFADRNPKAALLEGAEFLLHEQLLKLGSKQNPEISFDPKKSIESHPVKLKNDELDAVQKPDSNLPQIEKSGQEDGNG